MKRIISLLLIVITLSSLLSGCDIGKIWNSGTTTSPTTTTTKEPPIEAPFEHGENLTNDDIRFIMEHLEPQGTDGYPLGIPYDFSKELMLLTPFISNQTIYRIKVDFDTEPYFICAYLNQDLYDDPKYEVFLQYFNPFSYEYGCNIELLEWYRFDERKNIPEKIDNSVFAGAFAIFDCYIVKDILNDKECDYKCKYFVPWDKGFDYVDIESEFKLHSDFLIQKSTDFKFDDSYYIPQNSFKDSSLLDYLIELDGSYYKSVLFSSDPYDPDTFTYEKHRDTLGEMYDEIIPYLTVFEEQDREGYTVYISLENLFKLCNSMKINK